MRVHIAFVLVALTCAAPAAFAQEDLNVDFFGAGDDFNYSSALDLSFRFYEAQRVGKLPDNMRVDWRGDALLNDGFRSSGGDYIDLSGGYLDAGDALKFVHPLAVSMSQIAWSMLEFKDEYIASGQMEYAKDAIKWGLDWIMRAHYTKNALVVQVGTTTVDHKFWGPPERISDDTKRPVYIARKGRPASDVAANAAAALAVGSLVFEEDEEYSGKLMKHAKELYTFAVTEKGRAVEWLPDSEVRLYNSSHYEDDMMWAACWLFKATLDSDYYQDCKLFFGLAKEFGQWNVVWNWDNMYWGALVLLQKIELRDYEQEANPEYQQHLDRLFDSWMEGDKKAGIKYTKEGFSCVDIWGVSRNTINTAALAFLWANNPPDEGRAREVRCWAESQTNILLGDNDRGQSYVVGWGDKYPQQPHHRAAACKDWQDKSEKCDQRNFDQDQPSPHILYGGLVFGECDEEFNDVRSNPETNEVATDANSGLTVALAALVGDNRCYGEPFLAPKPGREAPDHLPEDIDIGRASGSGNMVDPTVTAAALAKMAEKIGAKLVLENGEGTISTGGKVIKDGITEDEEEEEGGSSGSGSGTPFGQQPLFFRPPSSSGSEEEEATTSSGGSSSSTTTTTDGSSDDKAPRSTSSLSSSSKASEEEEEEEEAPKNMLEQLDAMIAPPAEEEEEGGATAPPGERKPDENELKGMAADQAGKDYQELAEETRKAEEAEREKEDAETAARIDAENKIADAQRRGLPIPSDLMQYAGDAAPPPPPQATMISSVQDTGAAAFAKWSNLQNTINGRRRLLRAK